MAIAEDLKNLAQDIIVFRGERADYVKGIKKDTADIRVRHQKEIVALAGNVKEMLATYDEEMKALARELKDFLTKSEAERLADFPKMMDPIRARIKDICKEVADLRARFAREHKEMAADLKDFLAKSETARLGEFKPFMADITTRVRAIRDDTKKLMGRLAKEHGELSKEVEDLLTRFGQEDTERAKEVKTELAGHRREMERGKAAWSKVYGGLPKAEKIEEEKEEEKEEGEEVRPKKRRKRKK